MNNNPAKFEHIKGPAPIMQMGHPVAYLTVPQISILDPSRNSTYFFPTVHIKDGVYKSYGNGIYATQFAKESEFRAKEFKFSELMGSHTGNI